MDIFISVIGYFICLAGVLSLKENILGAVVMILLGIGVIKKNVFVRYLVVVIFIGILIGYALVTFPHVDRMVNSLESQIEKLQHNNIDGEGYQKPIIVRDKNGEHGISVEKANSIIQSSVKARRQGYAYSLLLIIGIVSLTIPDAVKFLWKRNSAGKE